MWLPGFSTSTVLRELLQVQHQPSSGKVVMEDLVGEFLVGADWIVDASVEELLVGDGWVVEELLFLGF